MGSPEENADVAVIRQLAAELTRAEASGDAQFLKGALTSDAVIMPPGVPAIEGVDACAEWMRGVLEYVQREFIANLTSSTTEIIVGGDWAFERGTYCQTLKSRSTHEVTQESGKYLRVYRTRGEGWKVARIIWNVDASAD